MTQTRREFLWAMSAAAGGLAFQGIPDVIWSPQAGPDVGWTPGIETWPISTCLLCPARCGIKGRVVDGRLVHLIGNPRHPTSRGGLCPRGVAGVQILYHSERIGSPLLRSGPRGSGHWRSVTREQAMQVIAEQLSRLREAGHPEGLALLSGYCAGSMRDLWSHFLRAYGSPNHVADEFRDGTDQIMALMHGIPSQPGYDLERAQSVVSFGAPLFESWSSPLQAAVAFADPQATGAPRPRFIQIDTRLSRSAARAHEWVAVNPGMHAVLALGIAYVLIRDRLFDSAFVARHASGFEDFVDAHGRHREGYRSLILRHYRTEEVSRRTGVPVERIRSLARGLAGRRALFVCGPDVMLAPDGLLGGLAVHSLNVLMGSVNRPGGVLIPVDPSLSPLSALASDDIAAAGLRRAPVAAPSLPFEAVAGSERLAAAIGKSDQQIVRALLLYYSDPLASSSRPERWRRALDRIPFIVSFSPFLDDTTRQADVVLPDLLPYERWQDAPTPAADPHPVWGLARPMVKPYEGGTATGDAILSLARRLGGPVAASLPYETMEAMLKERARGLFAVRYGMPFGDAFQRRYQEQMEERGWSLTRPEQFDAFWEQLVQNGGWTDPFYDDSDPAHLARTPDGRIALMPPALLDVLAAGKRARRAYVNVAAPPEQPLKSFPLRLMPYRINTLSAGELGLTRWLVEAPTLLPDVPWFPWIEVHPSTARKVGLHDGDLVRVASERASYRARLKVNPGTAPGVVAAPYRLRHPDGEAASPLPLLDGTTDPLTGLPSWSSTFVRLERA